MTRATPERRSRPRGRSHKASAPESAHRKPPEQVRFRTALVDVTGHKQAEAALRRSEEQYRLLFEANPNPMWIFDATTLRFLAVNEAAVKLYGWSPAEFQRLTIKDIRPPEDIPRVLKVLAGQSGSRTAFTGQWRHRKKDGTVFPVEVTISSIRFEGRDARLTMVKDITERQQAEAALRRQRSLLESVMRTTDVMLVLLDPQFNFVWVNEAYARTCGIPAESIVGKNHFALYPSKENEAIFRKVRDTGQAVFYKDKPFAFPDQPERGVTYWDWSLSAVRGGGGAVTGLVFSLRETTKFKQAELALRLSEERLLLAQQSAGAGVWDWDIRTNRLVWSPQLFNLFGLNPARKEASFAAWRRALHPKDRKAAVARVQTAVRRRGRFLNEFRIVLPSGETRWINSIGETMFDERNRPLRMSGICLDITERKQLEATQRKLNRTFQALGHSSQALLAANDEQAYLRDVCRIIVEDCGHALVWVGFTQNDKARNVRIAASSGFEKGYLETLRLTWANQPRGRGPTGTAIRNGRVCLCRDMLHDRKFRPWRREAVRRGYASSIALPLRAGGKAFGALTIYSRDPDAFSADEVKLLTELTAAFTQGITHLRLRRAREQAEIALRESEERYRGLVETQTELICRCKPDGTLTFVNEAYCRYFSRTREELIGRKFQPLIPPEDRSALKAHLAALSPRRPVVTHEHRVIAPNGQIRWQRWVNRAFFDAQKRLTELQAVGRDVTVRKRAEEALRESEDRYRRLLEDDLTGNFLATPDGKIQYCNPAFVKIYGFPDRRSAERGNIKRFNPKEWPLLIKMLRAHEHLDRHHTSHRTVDGRQIHIVENLVGVFNRHKELVQIRGYVFDDTVRKQAEVQLQVLNATLERRVSERTAEFVDANERFRVIMDNALVGILTLNERGQVESFNPAAAMTFGYAPNEMSGLSVRRLMASPEQAQGEEFLTRYTKSGDQRSLAVGREVLGRRKDGQIIMLELNVSDFVDRGRRLFVVMVRDITRRKRLERELLEVGDRERQRIGHDLHDGLGQHLHALYYIATLLHRELKGDSPSHAAEAARLSRLIGKALDLARSLARGLQPVNPVPEGLMATLRELAQRTRALYRVDCRFECHAPVLVHRHTAANHLYRIAQEAVNNALKHGRPKLIRINLAAARQNIILSIRDDGVGIRPRVARSRGMGLHVMQYRADAISGSLLVHRRPEGGTEVACIVRRQVLLEPNDEFK